MNKKNSEYRILEVKDGFNHKFHVQRKNSFLEFKWWWTIDSYFKEKNAREYIDNVKTPLTKRIINI